MKARQSIFGSTVIALTLGLFAIAASAQTYPTRSVTLVVPLDPELLAIKAASVLLPVFVPVRVSVRVWLPVP